MCPTHTHHTHTPSDDDSNDILKIKETSDFKNTVSGAKNLAHDRAFA